MLYIAIGITCGLILGFLMVYLFRPTNNTNDETWSNVSKQQWVDDWADDKTWQSSTSYMPKEEPPKFRTKGFWDWPKKPLTVPEKSLSEQLQDALAEEDYLLAAKLRDQIKATKK